LHEALGLVEQKERDIKQLKHDKGQIEKLAEMSAPDGSVTISGTLNPKHELRFGSFPFFSFLLRFPFSNIIFPLFLFDHRNLRQEKSKLQQVLDNEKRRGVKLQSELAEVNQELIDLKNSEFFLLRPSFLPSF